MGIPPPPSIQGSTIPGRPAGSPESHDDDFYGLCEEPRELAHAPQRETDTRPTAPASGKSWTVGPIKANEALHPKCISASCFFWNKRAAGLAEGSSADIIRRFEHPSHFSSHLADWQASLLFSKRESSAVIRLPEARGPASPSQ
jgi:hypothetical protein